MRAVKRLFWSCPLCCHWRKWCFHFVTPGSGKFCSFNFLGSYQHESKCQRTGISLRTRHLFFWQLFGWFVTGKAFKATSDSRVPYCYHQSIKSLHSIAPPLKTLSVQDWPHPPIIQIICSISHREVALSPRMNLIDPCAQGKPTVN